MDQKRAALTVSLPPKLARKFSANGEGPIKE